MTNNEFKTITIIALSQVDVSKKYKMKTGVCQSLYIGVFVFSSAPVHFYDLWAPHKYQNQLKISVCLCDTAHRCIYVRLHTGEFVQRMGIVQIPIPIKNIGAFF